MKIALIIPLFANGGGQRFISTMANYWDGLGHDISIVSLREGKSFFELSDTIKIHSLTYVEIKTKNKFNRLKSRVDTFFKLRNKIKELEPDFVLSILSSTNVLTLLATRNIDTKVFVNDVMSPYRQRSYLEQKSRKMLYPSADGIIALTEEAKRIIGKETKNKNIVVIPRPVKVIEIDPEIKKEKIIINVGRFHPDKGQKYLLEICAKLKRKDWKFVLLGDGELRDELEELAKKLNIEDQVLMPGSIKNIDNWLGRASIFAFTSVSEAWGNALAESMAAGLPSVSFDCDVAPRHIIDDSRNGFMVPLYDTDQFVLRLQELIDDQGLREKIGNQAKLDSNKYKLNVIGDLILEFCSKQ